MILAASPLTAEGFTPFGTVILPAEDGIPFGPDDACLELEAGTPRFYVMRLRDKAPRFSRITRHRRVTQCLASVGGSAWLLAVAPPGDVRNDDARPKPHDLCAFVVPGDVAVMLARGTWHAGPFFTTPIASFFNLELTDTNVTDHQSCDLLADYGETVTVVGSVS